MMRHGHPIRWATTLLSAAAFVACGAAGPETAEFFEKRIRPVLAEHCFECHSADSKKLKGGLRADSRAGLLAGGDTRPAVVPGAAEKSLLIGAVRYRDADLQMPPKGRLPDSVVADLAAWIDQGAMFPEASTGTVQARPGVGPDKKPDHWAFQPVRAVRPPSGSGNDPASRNPIDRFIVAKLAEHGLVPAPPADRRTFIRRVAYDLTGLPPGPGEVEAFEADRAPDAAGRLVERLLASPGYGERWGRWWLDVARYADTNGQDENKVMANAWRYRDWVIRAFNDDKPFDQFTTEQLAGDLMPTEGVPEGTVFDRWTATGLLVMGPKMLAEQDKPKLVMDLVDEQIDVVSRAFLGLTVACARCHDHKFDPIAARDYYALAGIFKSTRSMENLDFVSKFNERRIASRDQLAAIETHEQSTAANAKALESAVHAADVALVAGRRSGFGGYLDAATQGSAETAAADPEIVGRLRSLLSADPATNTVSRTLRAAAGSPDRLAILLGAVDADAGTSTGLRLGPGKVGAGFVATGSNHLELPHSAAFDPAKLTVETWVRAKEFAKGGDTRRWLVDKNANEWTEGHYALVLDRDRAGAYLNIGGGKENVFAVWSTGPVLKPGRWHHLAFTYDGSKLRLFVDGNPSGDLVIDRSRVPGTTPLALAKRQDGYVHFKGELDGVRVFDRALDAARIKDHFIHPGDAPDEGVVARWEFDDLTDAQRDDVAVAETREVLSAPGGILALPKDARSLYPPATREAVTALERERDALKAAAPEPAAFALAVAEDKTVELPIHIRGSHLNLAKDPVPRGFIRAAETGASPKIPADRSGRLELAGWLTNPENPLTARVIVNRIWQAHFGEGLVRTPDNFGVRGETPSHPELLDWLAVEFIRSGWSVKAMHRLIIGSKTYRQSAIAPQPAAPADPDNRLLSRFPRQRLEAEMVRDALLAVSGRLDRTTGGSLTGWKNNDYVPGEEPTAGSQRRSVYLPIVRDRVYDVFTIFDFANPSVGMSKRTPTVVSHQALFFLNSPLVKDCARALADTVLATPSRDDTARVDLAFRHAFDRAPTSQETDLALRFLVVAARGDGRREKAAWSALCQTLFAANEFVYRD